MPTGGGSASGSKGNSRGRSDPGDPTADAPSADAPSPVDSEGQETRVFRVDERLGVLVIDGDLVLKPSDRVVIRVGTDRSDLIIVTGIAHLGGTLVLERIDSPAAHGELVHRPMLSVPVVVAGEVLDHFDRIERCDRDRASTPVDSSLVRTTAQVCFMDLTRTFEEPAAPLAPVDLDGDGITGVLDLMVMFQAMGKDSDDLARRADLDADGAITTADLVEQARRLGFASLVP